MCVSWSIIKLKSYNEAKSGLICISTESGGHASHDYGVFACAHKHAHMLRCVYTIFWHAQVYISVELDQIKVIQISMKLGKHTCHDFHVCVCACKHAHILACMHITFWHAQTHISAKLCQIREIKLSSMQEHCYCMHRLISQPNQVRLEISRYLWNQGNMLDISVHIMWLKQTIQHACMLYSCMDRPIYQFH